MKKLSKILKESVWGGMLNRSTGDSIRKEDDIITYDGQRMVEYIIKHYRINDTSEYPHYYKSDDVLTVPVITWKDKENKQMYHTNPVFYEYKPNVIYVSDQTHKDTLEKIKSNPSYLTATYEYNYVSIRPKKGDVNNRFLLEVIDFILDITEPTTYPIPDDLPKHILDKKKVNESVWGGMLDRSIGDTRRKEDTFHFNIKEMKPVDLGKDFPVYWADIDLEVNGEDRFDWEDVERMIPQIEETGWRLPKSPNEIYNMFGKDIKKRKYLHRLWEPGQKGIISSEETHQFLVFSTNNDYVESYWCDDDWAYLNGKRVNFENERCFDVGATCQYDGEFSLIRMNNMNKSRKIKIRLVKDK